jgi:LPS-assembly lipoprotein
MLLAGLAGALSGCGFHPLYGSHGDTAYDTELASIKVATIPDRPGQVLAEALREDLNPSDSDVAPRYVLEIKLSVTRADVGLLVNATASRSQVIVKADVTLKDIKSNTAVFHAATRTISAFDILTDDYATVVAQHSAEDRSLHDLSNDIRTRLAVFLQQRRASAGS